VTQRVERAEVVLEVVRAGLEVRLRSDAALLRTLGEPVTAPAPQAVPDAVARRLGRRVARVAGRLPWETRCLAQALAAQRLLLRRGLPVESHVAVTTGGDLAAHVWVTSGGHPVVGADDEPRTHVVTLSRGGSA
jgi:hypothetical protein